MAAHSQQAANENLSRLPTTLTSTAFPTWTKDRGYKGNGSNQFASTNFTRPPRRARSFSRTAPISASSRWWLALRIRTVGSQNGSLERRGRCVQHGGRVSQVHWWHGYAPVQRGSTPCSREPHGANASELISDGLAQATATTALHFARDGLDLLRKHQGYGDAQVAVIHTGGALTTTAQKTGIYNASKATSWASARSRPKRIPSDQPLGARPSRRAF